MCNFTDCENLNAAFFGPYKLDDSHFDRCACHGKCLQKFPTICAIVYTNSMASHMFPCDLAYMSVPYVIYH